MAGKIVTNVVQLGDSATPSQNLVIRTNVDGTFTIARGNAGATTQDILTIDANGRVQMPQSLIAVRATASGATPLTSNTAAVIQLNGEVFDIGGRFNNTGAAVGGIPAYSFMPDVPGIYAFSGFVGVNTATAVLALGEAQFYKNGASFAGGTLVYSTAVSDQWSMTAGLVQLNGTTDYVNLWGRGVFSTGTGQAIPGATLNIHLVSKL